eukprot:TRINITY_DN23324_c0_g1_i1.p1 TRINITY_DN23324_c0_g1~~TRINITY_DN23324_c0_g1_i1.p1  ORF type:complete len:213 (+),score=43.56 TRINITY_DN23324_c0_g1_i1:140-778(+)
MENAAMADGERRIWMTLNAEEFDPAVGEGNATHVGVCVEALTALAAPPIIVEVRKAKREHPTVKSIEWMRERGALKEKMARGTAEVLLKNENGEIAEGLSSNFFAFARGELQTAPDDLVLPGTISKLVFEICEKNRFTVAHRMPSVEDMDSWDAAFLTSTSRLILPIDEVRDYTDSDEIHRVRKFDSKPEQITRLQELLELALRENSTPIDC